LEIKIYLKQGKEYCERNWKKKKLVMMKKSILIVFFMMMFVMSSQLCFVHSRVLQSKEIRKDGVTSFVSSNNSSNGDSKSSFSFILASGPSKKGPGH
jgi:hypothetical protein